MSSSSESGKKGPWDPTNKPKSLRKPMLAPEPSLVDPESPSTINVEAPEFHPTGELTAAVDETVVKTSKLSAAAKEWYPPGYQSQQVENLNKLIEQIKLIMFNLTMDPAAFDTLGPSLADEVIDVITQNRDTLTIVVDCILEESINERNLPYNGARLCTYLNLKFPDNSFRDAVLRRCAAEHQNLATNFESNPRRVHGFAILLGELYRQMEIQAGTGVRIEILAAGLIETMEILLTEPNLENVKNVTQVLKLCGSHLDELNNDDVKRLFEKVAAILNIPDLHSTCKVLVKKVLDLRRTNWGKEPEQKTPEQNHQSCSNLNEPVMYGPDGEIIDDEIGCFLDYGTNWHDEDEYCFGDSENEEEVRECFSQFLRLSEAEQKNRNNLN